MDWGKIFVGLVASTIALCAADEIQISQSANGIWEYNVGGGFKENAFQLGASGGGGFGVRAFGSSKLYDLTLGNVNAGWMFTDVQLPGTCLSGNWELRTEIFGGEQLRPERYLAGATFPSFRYHILTGTH